MVLALLGLAASGYSLSHHLEVHALGHTDAACNINAKFNCDEVALSKFSSIAGIPLGVFGLGYFAAGLVLLFIGHIRHRTATEHLNGYGAMTVVGVVTSLTLGSISAFSLGTFCIVCICIYALTLAQGVVVLLGRRTFFDGFSVKSATSGAMSAAIVVAVVVTAFNVFRPDDTKGTETASAPAEGPKLLPKMEDIPLAKSAYVGLGEDYRKGGDDAQVVIQEFADFQCPACSQMSKELETLHQEFGDKLLVVFRNYPLDNTCNGSVGKMHEYACKAAIMARCAGQYGKFWPYHNVAYQNQTSIDDAHLKTWAKDLGLTEDQINTCWTSPDLLAKIKDDVAEGNKLALDSTPTLYLNGHKLVSGRSLEELRAQIAELMH